MYTPPRPLSAGEVESPTKFLKWWGGGERGDLTGPQLLEKGCWERLDNFFQGGVAIFIQQKKLFAAGPGLQ